MTPHALWALQWFKDNGPVGLFRINVAPTSAMRRRLLKDGLIEKLPSRGMISLVLYQISAAGLKALEEATRK